MTTTEVMQTNTLKKALDYCTQEEKTCMDVMASSKDLEFSVGENINVRTKDTGKRWFCLSPRANYQLAKQLDIPPVFLPYEKAYDPEVCKFVLDRHREKSQTRGLLLRLRDRGKDPVCRAIFPDNHVPLDPVEFLTNLREGLSKDPHEFRKITCTEDDARAFVLLGKGDTWGKSLGRIFPGIVAQTSAAGSIPFMVSLAVWRQICDNGMCVEDDRFAPIGIRFREKRPGDLPGRFRQALKDQLEKVPTLSELRDGFETLGDIPVKDRDATMIRVAHRCYIPSDIAPSVLTAWSAGAAHDNMLGCWNAITRAAAVKDLTRSIVLERAGGRLLSLSPRDAKYLAN